MKRILSIMLLSAMLISSVSCSQNKNASESSSVSEEVTTVSETTAVTTAAETETASVSPVSDPAEGTNYTKGTFSDGVYTNEYANISLYVPETLVYSPAEMLTQNRDMYVANLTDEADINRETARIWDALFDNDNESVGIYFINTKLAFRGAKDVSAEDVLDSYKKWINKLVSREGVSADWKERETAMLGDKEYFKDVVYYDGSKSDYEAFYMRKLDDDLVCWVYFSSNIPERTPESYEALFA